MSYVRAVSPSHWIDLARGSEETIHRVTGELVRRGTDLSVFEFHSREDLELIAVAISAGRARPQHFHYVVIEDTDLEAASLRVLPTPGDTCSLEANERHRSLDLSGGAAEQLVRRLAVRGVGHETLRRDHLLEIAARLVRERAVSLPGDSWLLS